MGRFSAWLVQAGGIWTESQPSRMERPSMNTTAGKNPGEYIGIMEKKNETTITIGVIYFTSQSNIGSFCMRL